MTKQSTTIEDLDLRSLVDGQRVEADGSPIPVVNPTTGKPIAEVRGASGEMARGAIAAASRAFHEGSWSRLTPAVRAGYMREFARQLDLRRDLFEEIALKQMGATVPVVQTQVAFPISAAYRYADLVEDFEWIQSTRVQGPPVAEGDRQVRMVTKVPAGVVSAITPFNFPFMMNIQKVFPSLGIGCTTVLKPTPDACLDAALLIEAAEAAEIPAGVLNVLMGAGAEAGEVMASDARVDVVTFTGSTPVGRRIMELAAPTVKRVVLELGGKSPNIVFDDADLDAFFASEPTILRHAGQGCAQLTRILVQRGVYGRVVEGLVERMSDMVVGDPADPSTDLGPVANQNQYSRIRGMIDRARAEGITVAHGGGRPEGLEEGWFIEPTLFIDVDNSSAIAQEEVFGPVLVVIPFDDENDAIAIAEDSPFGINGAVWTADLERGWRVAHGIRAGNFGINCVANVMEGPHGGFKQTGIGREWWGYSLDEYVELRGFTAVSG